MNFVTHLLPQQMTHTRYPPVAQHARARSMSSPCTTLFSLGARTDLPLYASCGPDERGRVGRSLPARLP